MCKNLNMLAAAVIVMSPSLTRCEELPDQVRQAMKEGLQDCKDVPNFKPGFIKRKDINGDGVPDYILDYGFFECGSEPSTFCGTGGCQTTVFASISNGKYEKVLDDVVRGVIFRKVKGRYAMLLDLHGSACGKFGADQCGATLYWNGYKFSPAH